MDGERNGLNGGEPATVRALREGDLSRLVRVDAAITGRTRTMWYERKLRHAYEEADIAISLGAECDGLLVGALMGSVRYGEFGLPEPVAVLDTVLVDPPFARRGVARAMLDQLLTNLRALRVSRLRTEVAWDEHELLGFFARAGFVPVPRLVLEREVPCEP